MRDRSYRFEGTGKKIGVPHNSEYRYILSSSDCLRCCICYIKSTWSNPATNSIRFGGALQPDI